MLTAVQFSQGEKPLVQFEDLLSLIKESNKEYDVFASYLLTNKGFCPHFPKIADFIRWGVEKKEAWAVKTNPFVDHFYRLEDATFKYAQPESIMD